jgi:site-specific recombinase XerD
MDVLDAVDEYLSAKRNSVTVKTYRWYNQRLQSFTDYCKLNDYTEMKQVTVLVVQRFISDLPTTNSYTRHGYAQVIKGFLSWCSQDEEFDVKERTVRRIELPKVEISEVHLFSDQDINKLFKSCDKLPYPHRARAIVHLLLDTGIRISELAYDNSRPKERTGLRLEHTYVSRDEDYFIRVMGKGRKTRTVGLGHETRLSLNRYIKRERGPSDCPYVFLSRRDEPLSVRMAEQLITDLGELANVHPCYPHLFRHTFAVNSLLNGVSELVLMRLMGHTSLESTKIYVRAMSEMQAMKSAPSVVDTLKGAGTGRYSGRG